MQNPSPPAAIVSRLELIRFRGHSPAFGQRSRHASETHPPYPTEFRERLVELVRSGRSPEELSKEFEPSAQTIRNWVAQADRDAGKRSDGLTTAEREELRRRTLASRRPRFSSSTK
jgi:transposase